MSGKLDWKWIGIGVLIMLALNLVAGVVLALALGSELEGVSAADEITLSGGQIALVALLNFLAFLIGGFIVGLKSAGRTILEPGISAAAAVAVALLLSGSLTAGNVLVGGLVPFLAGVFGGWLGEQRQAAGSG